MTIDKVTLLKSAQRAFQKRNYEKAESLCADVLVADPACVPAHQLLVRVYLKLENKEKATELFNRRNELPINRFFYRWGLIAEDMEDLAQARAIYEAYLEQYPQHPAALYRLGLLCLERNQRTKAIDMFMAATRAAPDFAPAFEELGRCFAEDECWGLAAQAYHRVLELKPDSDDTLHARALCEAQLRELNPLPDATEQIPTEIAPLLQHLFVGRENVHARQWIDANGRTGYSPVREAVNERLLRMHVQGEVTLGVYPVRADQTVLFGAIDIDVRKAVLKSEQDSTGIGESLRKLVQADAQRLTRFFDQLHIPVYAEDSGFKGMHIWLFLAEPLPAGQVKRFLEAVIQRVGPPTPQLQWEIFPKQETVAEDQLGNLIKIPLGIHQKTGRRCLFTDVEGQVYADQMHFLKAVERVEKSRYSQAAARLLQSTDQEDTSPQPGTEEDFPEFATLFNKCEVVSALKEKAEATHHLDHTERIVLKCVLAHAGERGKELIHAIMRHCLDYSPRITGQQIERTPPYPISCPKIRQRLPHITASLNCACHFELPEGGYPSPLLYIDQQGTKGQSRKAGTQGELIDRFITLRRELQRTRGELERVEDDLRYAMQLNADDEIHADGWILRREENGRLQLELESP